MDTRLVVPCPRPSLLTRRPRQPTTISRAMARQPVNDALPFCHFSPSCDCKTSFIHTSAPSPFALASASLPCPCLASLPVAHASAPSPVAPRPRAIAVCPRLCALAVCPCLCVLAGCPCLCALAGCPRPRALAVCPRLCSVAGCPCLCGLAGCLRPRALASDDYAYITLAACPRSLPVAQIILCTLSLVYNFSTPSPPLCPRAPIVASVAHWPPLVVAGDLLSVRLGAFYAYTWRL